MGSSLYRWDQKRPMAQSAIRQFTLDLNGPKAVFGPGLMGKTRVLSVLSNDTGRFKIAVKDTFLLVYKSLLTLTIRHSPCDNSRQRRFPVHWSPGSQCHVHQRETSTHPATLPCLHSTYLFVEQYMPSQTRLALRSVWRPPLCLAPTPTAPQAP